MAITVDKQKKEKIEDLVKSLRELDGMMSPFQEQRKELRTHYIENGWLTKEEFSLVKKSFNLLKKKTDMNDLSAVYDIVQKEVLE